MVVLAAAVILAGAVAWIGFHPAAEETAALAAHQLDARTALTPAEQGLFADLRIVAEEIAGDAAPPSPDALAEEGLPPFVPDASWQARGGHAWVLRDGAYIGITSAPEIAGSMILRMDAHGTEIWLKREAEAPPALDDTSLIANGWKEAVSTFTAGVTR